jgi:hypothetical protein
VIQNWGQIFLCPTDGGNDLRTVVAYIDLNGGRAGRTENPKDYRFFGYAEALAGNEVLQLAAAIREDRMGCRIEAGR